MPLYGPAQWLPSAHFDKGPTTKSFIIIHGTGYSLAQTAADVAHDFQTTNPNSTHFAVGRAGDVAQMVAVEDVAWGNGIVQDGPNHGAWWDTGPNPNQVTVSIEHVNDSQNGTPLSPEQQQASFELVAWLCKTYNIPARPADASGGITGHYSIESIDRASCPGAYPWEALWAYLGAAPVTFTPWMAPGAEAMSEFARQSNGTYLHATCVEAAALMCLLAQKPHLLPSTGDELQAMVNAWRAVDGGVSSQGASSYVDATNWLRGLGLRVDENVMDGNWWATLQSGLEAHEVYLVGVTNAQGLPGDEAGVQNHGLAALGIDSNGNIVCGDPDNAAAQANMPGNPLGHFVTYTQQDFINGSISSLTRVYPAMLSLSDPEVAKYFTANADGSWHCIQTGFSIGGANLGAYQSWPAMGAYAGLTALGLPLSDAHYLPQAQYPGALSQNFERGDLLYDPNRVYDSPAGASGSVYVGKEPTLSAPAGDDEVGESNQLASLQAQLASDAATITKLQAELAALPPAPPPLPADLHSALAEAANLLNPSAQAAAALAAVMKELGF